MNIDRNRSKTNKIQIVPPKDIPKLGEYWFDRYGNLRQYTGFASFGYEDIESQEGKQKYIDLRQACETYWGSYIDMPYVNTVTIKRDTQVDSKEWHRLRGAE